MEKLFNFLKKVFSVKFKNNYRFNMFLIFIDLRIKYLENIAFTQKVNFLDLTPSLTKVHENNLVTIIGHDYHPNSLGTRIMAREIYSIFPLSLKKSL